LVLVIQPSGAKGWAQRFRRPDGRGAKLTLGPYVEAAETDDEPTIGAPLTLPQARELSYKIARQRARGVDVIAEHFAAKSRRRAEHQALAQNTFGAAVREFFVEHRTRWGTRPRRWRGDARLLGLDWPRDCDPSKIEPTIVKGSLADTWGDRPLASIDAHDCFSVIDESKKRGIPGLKTRNRHASDARGRKAHAALSVFFKWAVQRRKSASNPTIGLWHPGAPPARDRVLSDAEIKLFWVATEKVPQPFCGALRLLLLTGCRAKEIIHMRRDELDKDELRLPASRTKNHRGHVVPLSALAQEVLAAVPHVEGDLVFTTNGRTAVSGLSRIKQQLDAAMGDVPPWVIHDLRRTCASGLQRLGVRVEVIERALNHVSGSFRGVAGTYMRDALTDEVCDALVRWSQHISGLTADDTGKIVKLQRKGK
jgi:integrase